MARRPFDSQYEDPYDPWPQDRQHWLVWLIFFAPGSLTTWKEYMFPERGQVWASGRRAHNKIVQVLYSLSFWFTLFALGYAFYHMHQMSVRQSEREAEDKAISTELYHQRSPSRMTADGSVLKYKINRAYMDCWQRSGYSLPRYDLPIVQVFFDNEGNITGDPVLLPLNSPRQNIAMAALEVARQCEVEVPPGLRYLSRILGKLEVRFDPTF